MHLHFHQPSWTEFLVSYVAAFDFNMIIIRSVIGFEFSSIFLKVSYLSRISSVTPGLNLKKATLCAVKDLNLIQKHYDFLEHDKNALRFAGARTNLSFLIEKARMHRFSFSLM